MKKNVVKRKSFDFALEIIRLYKILINQNKEYVLSKQLLKSGTSIGAMVRESEYAESKADFIHKLAIALKEANECEYWILLLYHSNYIVLEDYKIISREINELIRLLISIIKSSKLNNRK
jgi:four helix bundle protein